MRHSREEVLLISFTLSTHLFFFTFLNIDEIVMASVNLSCIGYFDQPNTGFTVHLYTGKSMKNTSSTEADVQ